MEEARKDIDRDNEILSVLVKEIKEILKNRHVYTGGNT